MPNFKTCPHCGYEKNRAGALMCAMCGSLFPEGKEKIAKRMRREKALSEIEDIDELPERRDYAQEMRVNKRQSITLLLGFPVIFLIIGWAIGTYGGSMEFGMGIALGVALIYLLIVYFQGDSMILGFSGAKKADPYLHKQLINVVEEMRIAAGLPAVEVYVINSDAANAFATGRDQDHAKVAVTTGLMKLMNREELQGVIAHEISHVRNLDIRYAMLVAALVGAVALLADGLRRALWWGGFGGRGRRSIKGGAQMQIIGLVVMILLAILAPLAAVMLQMAISRKREFLADSSSVELTRNPLGLANALEKLDHHHQIEQLSGANRATQHLFIVNPLKSFSMESGPLLSTHPPIQARIKLLKAMV